MATRATSTETDYTTTLYVPSGTLELYQAASVWQDFPIIVEMDVNSISDVFPATTDATIVSCYLLNGTQVSEPVKGEVNIIRMSDGTVKKLIMK